MAGDPVGFFEVRLRDVDPNDNPDLIEIFGNEQFYLGRNPTLCRRSWPDLTISNKHLRIHCILYEENPVANIPPFVYATDESNNGTYLKKYNDACVSSQSDRGILMGFQGAYLLDDLDKLRISDSVTLIYHGMTPCKEHCLNPIQEREKRLFASRYLVTGRLLGIGGFGKVLVGIDQRTQRQLACKVVNLRPFYGGTLMPNTLFSESPKDYIAPLDDNKKWPTKLTACFREFDLLKELDHPNIVRIEKVFWSPNSIFIFEELVTSGDLFSFLEYKGGRLADLEAAVIVHQILKGIEYLHAHDIVHRDLKPDNILMTSLEDGARIVITDFGNARCLPTSREGDGKSTVSRRMFSLAGTLEFAAPEIHKMNYTIPSEDGYSKAVDMWSIGSITTALLSGDVLFTDRNNPRYEQDPLGVIMALASTCDISIIDDDNDFVWSGVGSRPKNFIKGLLVLREEDRMTATQALDHPWFSDPSYAAEFDALYERSIKDRQPVPREPQLVERIYDQSSNAVLARQPDRMLAHPFRAPTIVEQATASPVHGRCQRLSPITEERDEPRSGTLHLVEREYLRDRPPISSCAPSNSAEDSLNQISLPSEPPASGYHAIYDFLQDDFVNDRSRGKELNRLHQYDQRSSCAVSKAASDSLVVPETPIPGTNNAGSSEAELSASSLRPS